MAVPTIATVTPAGGRPTGGTLIWVTGTNFRLPPDPPAGYVGGTWPQTVEATMTGSSSISSVAVVSTTKLFFRAPRYTGSYQNIPYGADLTLKNLDDDGDPIVGEEVTAASCYLFDRKKLTDSTKVGLAARELIRQLRRSLLANSVFRPTGIDFDSNPEDLKRQVDQASLPVLELVGPDLVLSPEHNREQDFEEDVAGDIILRRPPPVYNLFFDFICTTEKRVHAQNLLNESIVLLRELTWLSVLSDPLDLGSDDWQHHLRWDPANQFSWRSAQVSPTQDLHQWTGRFYVEAVDIDADMDKGWDATAEILEDPYLTTGDVS